MAESLETPRRSSRGNPGNHHCPTCGKAYERADHLARHLDSRECVTIPEAAELDNDSPHRAQIAMSGLTNVRFALAVSIAGVFARFLLWQR